MRLCTSLEEVVPPSTLKKIGFGAFYNCTSCRRSISRTFSLSKKRFTRRRSPKNFSSVVSFGDYAFRESKLNVLSLPRPVSRSASAFTAVRISQT
ncbi:MAG: leucine-rich repeat protein [Christensenellaceae bacterium]